MLVVEDDALSANTLEAYLRRDGFEVAIAEDGERGVEMHARWRPDLVLLDVMLPKLSGTEVLSIIRRLGNTPVIMVTAIGDEPEKLGALRYGADDYVVKPYNPKEVVARVVAVLRRTDAGVLAPKKSTSRWFSTG
ncbi:response regulator [Pseudomonas proteolytica]|nr:response regulator [Pseudomonas proteolytica]